MTRCRAAVTRYRAAVRYIGPLWHAIGPLWHAIGPLWHAIEICRPGQLLPAHLVTGVTNSPLLAFLVLDGHDPSRAICSRSGANQIGRL